MSNPPPIPGYPPPLPVTTLNYDQRMSEARPGIITAMGVLSIVIGCISGLMSLSGILSTMMFFAMSRTTMTTTTVTTPTVTVTPGTVTVNSGVQVNGAAPVTAPSGGTVTVGGAPVTLETSEDAMPDQQRAIVVATLSAMSNLNEQRVQQLNLLLQVSGQKVFPFGDRTTHELIRRNVTERGTLPSTTGEPGATYFLVGNGRLELYDDHAVFRPDGSSAVVSATTNPSADEQDNPSGASSGGMSIRTSRRGGMGRTTVVAGGPPFRFAMSKPAMIVSVVTSIISLGLAIYLLVIGILVMRESLAARKLHWIYVWIKIPLVFAAAISAWFVWNSFGNTFVAAGTAPGSPPPPPGMGAFMALGAVFSTLFGLAYPVGLIFVLMSRTAKQYYSAERPR